jgi:hypothetical protein
MESVMRASRRVKAPTTSEGGPPAFEWDTKSAVRFPKPRQSPGYVTFSLDKDPESLAHAFWVDQRLELEPRFRAVCLGLSFIVEVRKFIPLRERQ